MSTAASERLVRALRRHVIDERVLAAVADGVQRAGERLSRVEQVKRFTLLGE